MQIGLFCCRMRLPSFPADCGRLIWMCTHLAIYLHHLPISHGAYSHLFAVADDNAPLTIVQAVWLSSSCRTFHLGTQSQRDDWLTYAFSGVLCSPWDFSCGYAGCGQGFRFHIFPSTCQRWNLHSPALPALLQAASGRTYTSSTNTQVYFPARRLVATRF